MSFSSKTTAEEVADAFSGEITGKNVLITGTTIGGIGFETARAVAKYANLTIITGYNPQRLQLTEEAIKKEFPSANIRKLTLDLSSLAAVRKAAAEVNAYTEPLHVLINNATGLLAPFSVTEDGFERQMATGHIGPFLFTGLLVPKLLAARTGTPPYTPRVVFVSSLAHAQSPTGIDLDTYPTPQPDRYKTILEPYNETKSANILTAIELSRRAKGKILSVSLHPGVIRTNGAHQEHAKAAFEEMGLFDENGEINPALGLEVKTLPQGAATTLVAAFDPSLADKPGAYLSDCKVATEIIAPHSSNLDNAKKLWDATEKAAGETFTF